MNNDSTPKKFDNRDLQWMMIGFYYGYPSCCIAAFVKRDNALSHQIPFGFEGVGYVPCVQCAARSEEDLTMEINAERVCQFPFPFDSENDDDHVSDAAGRASRLKDGTVADAVVRRHRNEQLDHYAPIWETLMTVVDDNTTNKSVA